MNMSIKGVGKMSKNVDLRVQRTYKYLMNALLSLMEEKNFKDITVQEICDKAMVRRATFYKHFGDKYELITFYIHQLQEEFRQSQPLAKHHDIREYFASIIYHIWQFVEENRDALSKIIRQLGNGSPVLDILSSEIQSGILAYLKQDFNQEELMKGNPALMASMITGAMVFTFKQWLMGEIDITRQEILDLCLQMLR